LRNIYQVFRPSTRKKEEEEEETISIERLFGSNLIDS
jgi:hypothetical protein